MCPQSEWLIVTIFKRLIFAMKATDLSPEIIESCLMYYVKKYIPLFNVYFFFSFLFYNVSNLAISDDTSAVQLST